MAVVFTAGGAETHGTALTGTSGTAPVSGSDTGRFMLGLLMLQTRQGSTPTAVWDVASNNQTMTLLGSIDTSGTTTTCYLFGLLAPGAAASGVITFSWPTSSYFVCSAMYEVGVDQNLLTTSAVFSSGTGTQTAGPTNPPSLAITSATNNLTVALCSCDNASPSISITSQSTVFLSNTIIPTAASDGAGTASNTHSFGLSGAGTYNWAIAGVNLVAVGQVISDTLFGQAIM